MENYFLSGIDDLQSLEKMEKAYYYLSSGYKLPLFSIAFGDEPRVWRKVDEEQMN